MRFYLCLLLLVCSNAVQASLFITSPVATSSFKAGRNTLTWLADTGEAAGVAPLASSFGLSSVTLMAGNSQQQTVLQVLGTVNPSKTKLSVTIDPTVGPDSPLYFIRFQSLNATTAAGVPLQAFSSRFSLTRMTGTFSPAVDAQNSGITSGGIATVTGGSILSTSGNSSATSRTSTNSTSPSPTPSHTSTPQAIPTTVRNVTTTTTLTITGSAAQSRTVCGKVTTLVGVVVAGLWHLL